MNAPTIDPNLTESRYQTAVRVATVAGAFSALVAAVLLFSYAQRVAKDPLESPQYKALKIKLAASPKDENLKQQIRELDQRLRAAYLRQRTLTDSGAAMLAVGLAVAMIAWRMAATIRRRLPNPKLSGGGDDPEPKVAHRARWAVVATAGSFVVLAVLLRSSFVMDLPAAVAQAPTAPANVASDAEMKANWPRFRGAGGLGIAEGKYARTWDGASGKNIIWKVKVSTPGNNSAVVWKDRIFVTGADEKVRKVFCYHAADGKLAWEKEVPETPQSKGKEPKVQGDTGFAASTGATDGERFYTVFANGDVVAFDFEGKLLWTRGLGVPDNQYGHAASLATYKNLVIVPFDQGEAKAARSRLYVLDGTNGKSVSEINRPVPASWSTPTVLTVDGKPQLLTAADPWVISYEPESGKEIWRAKVLKQDIGPSPVFVGDMTYVVSEFPCLSAVRANGQGDVTASHVAWKGEDGLPDTCSPLATDKYVLLLSTSGTLTCYEAKQGKKLWEQDFDSNFKASPSLADGVVYLIGDEGKCWVVELGDEKCTEVAKAELGDKCVASPAFVRGRIYLRGEQNLYCIGEK